MAQEVQLPELQERKYTQHEENNVSFPPITPQDDVCEEICASKQLRGHS